MSRADSYRLELRVGLLLIAGIVSVIGIILVSERFSFEGDYQVTAYLRDAGGLRANSPVTLAGLPIGKVKAISTDSGESQYPVRVVMAIQNNFRLPSDFELTVATSGIFGDAYLAFAGVSVADSTYELLPRDGTAKVYAKRGVIESATQQGMRLLSNMNELLDEESRRDVKRLLHGAADFSEESTALVKQLREQSAGLSGVVERMDATLTGIDQARQTLVPKIEAAVDRVGELNQRLEPVLAQAERTLLAIETGVGDVRGVVSDNRAEITALLIDLRHSAAALTAVAKEVEDGEGLLKRLISDPVLARDADVLAVNLVSLSDLLLNHPEALIFGMSNEERIRWREQRDRLRMRRAFNEGFRVAPEPNPAKPSLLDQTGPPHRAVVGE